MRDCYRVKCGQLENGLRFYTQYDAASSREATVISVIAGSFHGIGYHISHLVEHNICNEIKNLSHEDWQLLLWRTTGGPDDYPYIATYHTATTYGVADRIRKLHNRKLFSIFAQIVRNPFVTKSTLLSERAAVHQEKYLRWVDAGIEANIVEILIQAIFPKTHPISHPIDGYMGDVKKATLDEIRDHHHKYYVPANTFVVYLGPTHQEVRLLVEKEFDDWGKDWNGKRNCMTEFKLKNGADKFTSLKKNITKRIKKSGTHQYHVTIGFPTETYMSNDAEALDVLARILSGRMYQKLRDENYDWMKGAYRTPVFTDRTFAHGLLGFHFATLDKNFLRYGINAFYEQCDNLCKRLVGKKELETWRGYIYDYEYTDPFQRGPGILLEMIVLAVSNGDLDLKHLHSRGDRLKKLTRHKLLQVAKKYLSGHSAKVIISPA